MTECSCLGCRQICAAWVSHEQACHNSSHPPLCVLPCLAGSQAAAAGLRAGNLSRKCTVAAAAAAAARLQRIYYISSTLSSTHLIRSDLLRICAHAPHPIPLYVPHITYVLHVWSVLHTVHTLKLCTCKVPLPDASAECCWDFPTLAHVVACARVCVCAVCVCYAQQATAQIDSLKMNAPAYTHQ